MKLSIKEFESNKKWAVDYIINHSTSVFDLWADRCPLGISIDNNTRGDDSRLDWRIYWLTYDNGNPYYIGLTTDIESRIRQHKSENTHSATDKVQSIIDRLDVFNWRIVDTINASERYAMKLEFMWIVNGYLLYDIENTHYRNYAGWCWYKESDFELLKQFAANGAAFQDYQLLSYRNHMDTIRRNMFSRYSEL